MAGILLENVRLGHDYAVYKRIVADIAALETIMSGFDPDSDEYSQAASELAVLNVKAVRQLEKVNHADGI